MGAALPPKPKPQGPVSRFLEAAWDSYLVALVSAAVKGLIRRIPFSKSGNPTGTQDGPAHRPGRQP